MGVSEVARIKEQIATEYVAAKWGLSGLAYGTSKHQFITARMERIEEGRKELATRVGDEQAMMMVAETLVSLPEKPERSTILRVIEQVKGKTEHTAHLLDYLQDAWETIDLLVQEFGQEDAYKIIMAPTLANVGSYGSIEVMG